MDPKKIDESVVAHVAELARLNIKSDQLGSYAKNFQDIINYVAQLDEVNTEDTKPLANVLLEHTNLFSKSSTNLRKQRDDQKSNSLEVEAVLKNAPSKSNGQFSIEAVIEDQ